jgi:hypothetical protein
VLTLSPPYVALAVFCQEARQNPDGTLTLSHVLDRVTVSEQMGRLPRVASLVAVVALRCSAPWGTHQLGIAVHPPDGSMLLMTTLDVDTSAEMYNVARILKMDLKIGHYGNYWFDVRWDDRLVTRMQLSVRRSANGG